MSDPPSSVSSGSIDLDALRALVETWRTKGPNGVTLLDAWGRTVPPKSAFSTGYVMARKACSAELSALLASLGERRGTQEETKEEDLTRAVRVESHATVPATAAENELVPVVMSLDEARSATLEELRVDIVRSAARGQGPTFIAAKIDRLIELAKQRERHEQSQAAANAIVPWGTRGRQA